MSTWLCLVFGHGPKSRCFFWGGPGGACETWMSESSSSPRTQRSSFGLACSAGLVRLLLCVFQQDDPAYQRAVSPRYALTAFCFAPTPSILSVSLPAGGVSSSGWSGEYPGGGLCAAEVVSRYGTDGTLRFHAKRPCRLLVEVKIRGETWGQKLAGRM